MCELLEATLFIILDITLKAQAKICKGSVDVVGCGEKGTGIVVKVCLRHV